MRCDLSTHGWTLCLSAELPLFASARRVWVLARVLDSAKTVQGPQRAGFFDKVRPDDQYIYVAPKLEGSAVWWRLAAALGAPGCG